MHTTKDRVRTRQSGCKVITFLQVWFCWFKDTSHGKVAEFWFLSDASALHKIRHFFSFSSKPDFFPHFAPSPAYFFSFLLLIFSCKFNVSEALVLSQIQLVFQLILLLSTDS